MKKKLLISLISLILIVACKKDKEEPSISLKGKWTAESILIKEYENGTLTGTYTQPVEGTTYDFQTNGNLVISSPITGIESFPYTIMQDSKVDIDGEIIEIKDLTASSVTLFGREDIAPGEYSELLLKLKR